MSEQWSPEIEAFLAKLRETPRTWSINATGAIRDDRCRCPLEGASDYTPGNAECAAANLCLSYDANDIMVAADCPLYMLGDYARCIRVALLAACGLSEPQP